VRASCVLLAAAALVAAAPSAAVAESTSACHCYRDRSFDPERPSAADPYILSSSRSSLLSAAFGPSKRELVQAVMTGTSPDDLWVAHWAAAKTGVEASALLEAKGAKGSWEAALAPGGRLGKAFVAAMSRGASDADLAALVVDDVLTSRIGAERPTLAKLHEAGATTNEEILAVVLATRLKTSPPAVLASVKDGGTTWGMLLQRLDLTPKDLEGIIRQLASR
jgi:hypothetical protein